MVTVKFCFPSPLEFVAVIVPLYVPVVVGLPVNFPVVPSKLIPGIETVVL